MAGYATNFPYDGTAAMKPVPGAGHATPKIIAFPSKGNSRNRRGNVSPESLGLRECFLAWMRNCLFGSEMFCSLVREDARGVAYKLFSNANIATLAIIGFVVAALSIVYGA
ncbi:MAG: hypothetical protein IJI68_03655 [Eggerthellaceae bacterium]|nr:hypothetical protein [Eggerthellaceae bacterium]